MLSSIRTVCLLVAGVIHVLPVTGVFGGARLRALYGLEISDPNLLILMQHRAVLFGILGLLLIAAIPRPQLRPMTIAAGLVSACSFLVIAFVVGGYSSSIHRVVIADIVAVCCLLVAGGVQITERRR